MTVEEMLSELDDHGFEDISENRKLAVINDAIHDIDSRRPWPYLEAQDAAISISSATPTMPTGFNKVLSFVIPSISVVLRPERLETIHKSFASTLTTVGIPRYYYFVGSTLKVFPPPQETYTGTVTYTRYQTDVTADSVAADILIPARHHRVIVLGALARLYAMNDDLELSVAFSQQYEARLAQMTEDLVMRQFDMPDRMVDMWADDHY